MSRYSGHDWTQSMIEDIWEDVVKIAKPYGLDYYEPQIEIISSEQMLDNYSTHALPVHYPHWSFGKHFAKDKAMYEQGKKGLAFEVVINSNPSICYIMDNNSLAMQILVLAHAAIGHSAFFKNNRYFKTYTDAAGVVDFLVYARDYILKCEEEYGIKEVETVLDAAHALQYVSIDKSEPPKYKSSLIVDQLKRELERTELLNADPLWDSLFPKKTRPLSKNNVEENVLKYIRDNSKTLPGWKKNIINIVLYLNQYFYPQMQTQVSNEGFATFWHHHLLHDMYDNDLIDDGILLEVLDNHSWVLYQSAALKKGTDFWTKDEVVVNDRYSGINPYWLGFNMYTDIKRICTNPTEADKKEMPFLIGEDWVETIKEAAYTYNDSDFIGHYLSPKVINNGKFFITEDNEFDDAYRVAGTSAEHDYHDIRQTLSKQYDIENKLPQIYALDNSNKNVSGLTLLYKSMNNQSLHRYYMNKTLKYASSLWGDRVNLYNYTGNKYLGGSE